MEYESLLAMIKWRVLRKAMLNRKKSMSRIERDLDNGH